MYPEPGAPLFFFLFFFTLKCTESFSARSSLSVENRAEQVALLCECMYIKTIHDKSVCPSMSALSLGDVVCRRNILNRLLGTREFRPLKC